MATLIKVNHEPQKHLLKKRLALMPANALFKKNMLEERENCLRLINDHTRSPAVAYLKEKQLLNQISIEKGARNYQIKLMKDLLMFFIKWRKNLGYEAMALNILAQKIAQNITQKRPESLEDFIFQKLSQNFFLKIFVNEANKFAKAYQLITLALKQEQLFFPDKSLNRLEIICSDQCLTMNFHENDIDLILRRVLNQLKHSSQIGLSL